MCGLVGIAGDCGGSRGQMFETLLIVDSLRGIHSTGVAAVKRFSGDIKLVKKPGGPSNIMLTDEYRAAMGLSSRVLMGHNRYATVGSHTEDNAHPFVFTNIVGAHNGTLDPFDRRNMVGHSEYETDSQALFANIDQFGVEETINKLVEPSSAYALTWYDNTNSTIHFLRNSRRPLTYAYTEDRCTLIWASEREFIEFAAARHKIKLLNSEVYDPEVDTHCYWTVPKGVNDKFEVPSKAPLKQKVREIKYADYGSSYWEGSHTKNWKNAATVTNNVTVFRKPIRKDTKSWRPPYTDNKGLVLNKTMFERITQDGCCFCGGGGQKWGDFIQPFKSGGGTKDFDYLCEECYNDDDVFDLIKQII